MNGTRPYWSTVCARPVALRASETQSASGCCLLLADIGTHTWSKFGSMDTHRAITLIQHFLKEQGLSLTLAALEDETHHEFVQNAVPSGALMAMLNQHAENQALVGMQQLNLRSREQRMDDEALTEPVDLPIPNVLERTITNIHIGNILTVRAHHTRNICASGGTDRTVCVTDLTTGQALRTFSHHTAGVLGVDFHPSQPNLLLTCGMDGTHHLIDLDLPDDRAIVQSWKDHNKYVTRSKWSPDGRFFATCSYDRSACLYGPKDGQPLALLKRFQNRGITEAVSFTPDSTYMVLTVRDDNYLHYIKLDDLSTQQFNMNVNKDDFVSFTAIDTAFSPDGKYLLVATDKSRLILYRTLSEDQVLNFYGVDNNEYSQPRVAWHPSGRFFFVTSGERHICAYSVANRSIVHTLNDHAKTVRDLHFDVARGCLWSCSYDATVRQYQMA